jgi:hypothetical protein
LLYKRLNSLRHLVGLLAVADFVETIEKNQTLAAVVGKFLPERAFNVITTAIGGSCGRELREVDALVKLLSPGELGQPNMNGNLIALTVWYRISVCEKSKECRFPASWMTEHNDAVATRNAVGRGYRR